MHLLVGRSPLFKKNEKLIDPAAIGGIWMLLKEITQKIDLPFKFFREGEKLGNTLFLSP